ncbi:hypothetical protein [Streptomyces sp. NPDC039016]|uniref:hypothetical protein n=1 Tax=Streptomyces sp. NPDC039016 TaxID=3154330 RepID=UPI0033D5446F
MAILQGPDGLLMETISERGNGYEVDLDDREDDVTGEEHAAERSVQQVDRGPVISMRIPGISWAAWRMAARNCSTCSWYASQSLTTFSANPGAFALRRRVLVPRGRQIAGSFFDAPGRPFQIGP